MDGDWSNIAEQNQHFHVFPAGNNITTMEKREALAAALSDGITLNNEAYWLFSEGNFEKAIEKYLKAIQIKMRAYGEDSVHLCISLSGLADAYLKLGHLDNAHREATRMMAIARKIACKEQTRIALEILVDIAKARFVV